MITVSPTQAEACLLDTASAGMMPMLVGSPGIGKSAIVKRIADDNNLKLIDIRLSQCDPCDLLGFPHINKETNKASYTPMDIFPLSTDSIPEGYDGWLIFYDEANSADKAVQKAWYKTTLDRLVGNRKLHDRAVQMSAGNLDTDNAIVEEMSTALQSRMIHYELKVNHDDWVDWAIRNGIDHRITSFIKFKPNMLYTFKPDSPDKTYACPRTWEFANRFLQQREIGDHLLLVNLTGTLSEGVAREFYSYCGVYKDIPEMSAIIKNPTGTIVPTELSSIWALTGAIANHINEDNQVALMTYLARFPKEFQVVCLREVIRRDVDNESLVTVCDWIAQNSESLW